MTDTICITGNLTSAPERLEVSGGVPMVRFGLASTERRLEDGVWKDVHTNYYNVAVFRKLAENAYRSLERGQRVIVVGKLKVRPWESNGRSGTSMDLEASSLGPDLMFGIAAFTKTSRPAGAGSEPGAADSASAPPVEAEPTWSAPGESVDDVQGSHSTTPSQGELVGAAGWGTQAESGETPF